jgi:hypothetical protein
MLETPDILPVAQILGLQELVPFILDSIQLQEMSRIRVGDRDVSRVSHPSADFWKSLAGYGPRFSAREIQYLRNTIPTEMIGKERFDAGTLFEYMVERFQFCRSEWGMTDLPSEVVDWWKILYQNDCLECYSRKSGQFPSLE